MQNILKTNVEFFLKNSKNSFLVELIAPCYAQYTRWWCWSFMVGSKREQNIHINCCRLSDDVSFGCVINFIRTDLKLVSRWSVYWLTCISSVPYHDVFYEYVESNRSRSAHAYRTRLNVWNLFILSRALHWEKIII